MIVRKANLADVSRILELYEQLTEDVQYLSPEMVNRVFTEINSSPRQELLVAEHEGLVVGTLFFQITPNLSHGARPWAVFENMVVDARYRGQGIGRRLIEYAFARCREAGCYKVQLLSHKKRLEAHRFYRSLGFEESALGFRFYF
jgi:GNAT superfamily N-acetyltransferase